MAQLLPDFGALLIAMLLVLACAALLLAGAATRRLHDRGRSGAWLLVPAALLGSCVWLQLRLFNGLSGSGDAGMDMGLFALLFANNILYLLALAILFVQLVLPGTAGANRYGDAASA
jgi:uncharacterized membrane protein YhaH (DUF805 family)